MEAAGDITPAGLARDHWTPVFRFAMHLAGDAHSAEEITQETFLRAIQGIEKLQPGTKPRAWLMRIARNLFLDGTRRKQVVKFEPLEQDRDPAGEQRMPLEVSEEVAKVRAGLAHLPETSRSVFLMRVEGELPFSDIADALGISCDAARWHMGSARKKLMELLGEGSGQ